MIHLNGYGTKMVSKKFIILSGIALSTLALTACGPLSKKMDLEDARYWQRESASSSLYLRGPKAQQMLHQDLSNCTANIKELERLGEIRKAIPSNYNSDGELTSWDTPERDGYLYGEHLDYRDFETCMTSKGWERAEYLAYDDAARARDEYKNQYSKKKKSSLGRENVTSINEPAPSPGKHPNTND